MEFIENAETVRSFIKTLCSSDSQENKDKLSQLARNIGSIVAKIHANKIIHGDLTTSNILIEGWLREKITSYFQKLIASNLILCHYLVFTVILNLMLFQLIDEF